jgi:hypothetical protein
VQVRAWLLSLSVVTRWEVYGIPASPGDEALLSGLIRLAGNSDFISGAEMSVSAGTLGDLDKRQSECEGFLVKKPVTSRLRGPSMPPRFIGKDPDSPTGESPTVGRTPMTS